MAIFKRNHLFQTINFGYPCECSGVDNVWTVLVWSTEWYSNLASQVAGAPGAFPDALNIDDSYKFHPQKRKIHLFKQNIYENLIILHEFRHSRGPLGETREFHPTWQDQGDYLFGNETEAQAYAEAVGWDTKVPGVKIGRMGWL